MPAAGMTKTVVFLDGRHPFLVIVPADRYGNVSRVRAAVGSSDIRKATDAEIERLFPPAEVGAMPPLVAFTRMPIYLDRLLTNQESIGFAVGINREVVHMSVRDFRRLNRPVMGEFSSPDAWDEIVAPAV
jgi:prolyl-tRNA editing enzyme YbaK/EbsC (Cys-tRNA(Pro) deacylase)